MHRVKKRCSIICLLPMIKRILTGWIAWIRGPPHLMEETARRDAKIYGRLLALALALALIKQTKEPTVQEGETASF